jgi:peptidoglycan/xylan/chitin deacetylase (PgdA/CDA1 family)
MPADALPRWRWVKARRLARWLELRSAPYIAARLVALVRRYGATSAKSKRRIVGCITLLERYQCRPTFPTPGRVVHRDPEFFRKIQNWGAELNVHGYDHIDFLGLSREEANRQFSKAVEAFDKAGIQFDGFRCPYLSYSRALLDALPPSRFSYSSNQAILWNVLPGRQDSTAVFDTLQEFYRPVPCEEAVSSPRLCGEVVELPIGIPDDLQMFDGLNMEPKEIGRAWSAVLHQTHRRGELFVLLFHPELLDDCQDALKAVLDAAITLQPRVWITTRREVAAWWREKAGFSAEVSEHGASLRIRFVCSERATILLRNVVTGAGVIPWDGATQALQSRELEVGAERRPFIGVAGGADAELVGFLREQGFILETGLAAPSCAIYLDANLLTALSNRRRLLDYIESSQEPLARFGRWPYGAKSALSITGDLDALSLVDYAARVFVH